MEQQSKRTASAGASRVDNLLGLLSVLSQDDPPPALRGRLELLSSRRWRREVELERWLTERGLDFCCGSSPPLP